MKKRKDESESEESYTDEISDIDSNAKSSSNNNSFSKYSNKKSSNETKSKKKGESKINKLSLHPKESKKEEKEKEKEEEKDKINEIKEEKPKELTEKEIREKEISDLGKMLLKKNLDGRRFYEDRIKNWSQAILDEMMTYLLEKYPKYGFGILIFIAEEHDFFTAGQAIFNRELDSKIIEKYQSSNMSAILVIFCIKKRKRNVDILYIDPEHFFNINRLLGVSLEKRDWSEKYEKYLVNAVNDINSYLIKDISLGKSFLHGFVLRNNYVRMHSNFKFGNLEFLPYITSYSNDTIIAHLFVFFLNN